jgi:hypothetical protein
VSVAVLLDNFVNASARDEEKAELKRIEEAKSFQASTHTHTHTRTHARTHHHHHPSSQPPAPLKHPPSAYTRQPIGLRGRYRYLAHAA